MPAEQAERFAAHGIGGEVNRRGDMFAQGAASLV